jgi:hypothetical protein
VKKEKEPDGTNHQVVLRTLVDTRRSNVTVLDSRLATDHQVAAGAYPFLESIEDAVFIQMWNLTPTHRSNFDKSSPLSIELGKSKISSPGYAECVIQDLQRTDTRQFIHACVGDARLFEVGVTKGHLGKNRDRLVRDK